MAPDFNYALSFLGEKLEIHRKIEFILCEVIKSPDLNDDPAERESLCLFLLCLKNEASKLK